MLSIQGKTSTYKPQSSHICTTKFPVCDTVYRNHTQEAVGAQWENVAKGVELKTKWMHARQVIILF